MPRACVNACNERTCSNLLGPRKFCPLLCRVGLTCDCKEGYGRNECGKCIKECNCKKSCKKDKIPFCTGINETSEGCVNVDEELTCENYFKKRKPRSSSKLCSLNVCHCIDGYIRNKYGVCVFFLECDFYCKPNGKSCRDPYEIVVPLLKPSQARRCKKIKYSKSYLKKEKPQKNVCECQEGYAKNKHGRCVLEEECDEDIPSKCTNPCPKKDEVSRCLNSCNKRTCDFLEERSKCRNECVRGCDCIDKQRKNSNNQCISEWDCENFCTRGFPI